jgi:glycosyltransferase involved in cell wall biosynthesis
VASIYYTFAAPPVTGGDMIAVDHVAALDRMGFNARAYYCAPDQGFTQFSIPVARPGTPLGPDDVLVLGETQREMLAFAGDLPCIKVMHNQNPYFTFFGFRNVAGINAYPFAHMMVLSDFTIQSLRDLGVTHPIVRVRPALPDYFAPAPKMLQIAYTPLKRQIEASFLPEYFKARVPEYAHVPWVPLLNMPRAECARVMAQSAIWAGLPLLESLGLMNLEAMASGCHVVGYLGHGGVEYATPQNGDWIDDGDHAAFAAKLKDACRLLESGADNPRIAAGHATAAQFSRANFEAELGNAWARMLGDRIAAYRR